jgi:hypothetical protein
MARATKSKESLSSEARLTLIDMTLLSINGTRHLSHSEAQKGKFSTEANLQVSVEERDKKQVVCIIASTTTRGAATIGRKKDIPAFELEIKLEGVFEISKSSNIKTVEDVTDIDAFTANSQIIPTLVIMTDQNLMLMGYRNLNITYKIGSFVRLDD